MGKRYEDWLQLSVGHVVPRGSRTQGYLDDWLEDIANLVTCCRACNEFSNGYRVREPDPTSLSAIFDARDRIFVEKQALVLSRHAQEREWFGRLVTAGQPVGPADATDPTP